MRVLSVAFEDVPIGPCGGGSEQILATLDTGLVRRGNRSMVIAKAGSSVAGELIESSNHAKAIEAVLAKSGVDLIHFHGLDFHKYLPDTGVPMLATLHLPISFYPGGVLVHCRNRGVALNCVSRHQADSWPVSRSLPVIANGVRTDVLVRGEPEDYLLWLGRICPEKGTHVALRVARELDMRLIVAGPVHSYDEHRRYFHECVEPLLDNRRVWRGPADYDCKRKLLAGARCLLVPSSVAETSSLVAMEAMSCGTPVVAFRSGALPEVVDHGKTGFIVDSPEAMARAIARVDEISREACRARAMDLFDANRMIESYLELYAALIAGEQAAAFRFSARPMKTYKAPLL